MNQILSQMERIFPELKQDRKLRLAWIIFISAIGWMLFFVTSYSNDKSNIDQFLKKDQEIEADSKNVVYLENLLEAPIIGTLQNLIYYYDNFYSKKTFNEINADIINTADRMTSDLLFEISSARGAISGISFFSLELKAYNDGFMNDLTLMETYFKDYHLFINALKLGDYNEAIELISRINRDVLEESNAGFYTRLKSFSRTNEIINENHKNEKSSYNYKSILFKVKKGVTAISLLYTIYFIISFRLIRELSKLFSKSKDFKNPSEGKKVSRKK